MNRVVEVVVDLEESGVVVVVILVVVVNDFLILDAKNLFVLIFDLF